MKIDGVRSVIDANTVSGFRYGIRGPIVDDGAVDQGINIWNLRMALSDPGSLTSNFVADCYVGVVAVPAESLVISANTLANCIRPMVVIEESEQPTEPSAVTGNIAAGCLYPLEIGGKLILVRAPGGSAVTVGVDKTIYVKDSLRALPVGTVVNFSGGGIFTVTKPVTAIELYNPGHPYPLIGDVAGTDIGSDEYGTTAALVLGAAGSLLVNSNNIDTAAGGP
jgi:hypothetical protein